MSRDQLATRTTEQSHSNPELDVTGAECPSAASPEHQREHFYDGARWQRDLLCSDEAIERVAQELGDWTPADWDNPDSNENRQYWTDKARATVTALLGEDT